jgi:hypothetical protein
MQQGGSERKRVSERVNERARESERAREEREERERRERGERRQREREREREKEEKGDLTFHLLPHQQWPQRQSQEDDVQQTRREDASCAATVREVFRSVVVRLQDTTRDQRSGDKERSRREAM